MDNKPKICENHNCRNGMIMNEKGEMDYCKHYNCTGYKQNNKLYDNKEI